MGDTISVQGMEDFYGVPKGLRYTKIVGAEGGGEGGRGGEGGNEGGRWEEAGRTGNKMKS